MLARKIVNIEVVGTCNLRCPSCPVGNYGAERWKGNSKGVMAPELFRDVMARVRADFDPRETCITLYSWGEPLIHPEIGALVGIVKAAGFKANLSTNLNYIRHLPSALAAGVDEIVVSLSGIHPETYEKTHAGGDAAKLRQNLLELGRLRASLDGPPAVYVNYHLYRHNLGRDLLEVESLCRDQGFKLLTNIAYYLPVEKMLGLVNGEAQARPPAGIEERLIVPVEDQIRISAAQPVSVGCDLRDNRLDIDVDGSVKLCCSVFEKRWNVADSYFDQPLAEIQARRLSSPLCAACMSHGIDKIFTQVPVLAAWQKYANHFFETTGQTLVYQNGILCRHPSRASAVSGWSMAGGMPGMFY